MPAMDLFYQVLAPVAAICIGIAFLTLFFNVVGYFKRATRVTMSSRRRNASRVESLSTSISLTDPSIRSCVSLDSWKGARRTAAFRTNSSACLLPKPPRDRESSSGPIP